eukprot:gnl/Hemi2/16907_TR5616_c0_g16_i1.p2 gnl/Hemi2/16907_TR5616_c0_g16~~gnl/Hemi2/16907_TR5616_c0_g16_i1.p2  ORF type:complete len:141 (+),score=59.42 gnl/Hemi2/16907_TR5616_c0_g16_i1:42-464(+)
MRLPLLFLLGSCLLLVVAAAPATEESRKYKPRMSVAAHAEQAMAKSKAGADAKAESGWSMPPTTTAMEPPPIIEAPSSYPNPILPWDIHKLYQFRGWNVQHDPMYWDHWLKWHYYQRNFPPYKGAYQPPSYSSTYTDPFP